MQAAAGRCGSPASTGIHLCGIAKRLEEIWLPDADFPVILPRNSDALFLIQRIRDEAHRFAITYQRQAAQARHRLGARRDPRARPVAREGAAQALRFGGAAEARRAAAEIAEVKGIGPALAATVHEHLRADGAPAPR